MTTVGAIGANAPMIKYEQSPNRQQSVTDSQTTTIRSVGELETLLKGGHSGRFIDMRNSNISPEVWAALSRGEEVQVKLQQMAPERVNLFMPLVASVMQIIGGANGAAYNEALSQAVQGHVNKAADFVSRHGMSYSLNPFGGGQHIDVMAEFSVLPKKNQPQEPKKDDVKVRPYQPPKERTQPRTNSVPHIDPKEEEVALSRKTRIDDIVDSIAFKLLKTKDGYSGKFSWENASKSTGMSIEKLKGLLSSQGIDITDIKSSEDLAERISKRSGVKQLSGSYKDTASGNTIASTTVTELDMPETYKYHSVEKGKVVERYVLAGLYATEAFDNGIGVFTRPLHSSSGGKSKDNITEEKVKMAVATFDKYKAILGDKFTVEGLLDKASQLAKSDKKEDKIEAGRIYAALLLQDENNARGNDGKGVSNGHVGAGHYGAKQEAIVDRANIFVDGSRALNHMFNGGSISSLDSEMKKGLDDLVNLYNKKNPGQSIDISKISTNDALKLLEFSKSNLTKIKEVLDTTGISETHTNLVVLSGLIPNVIGSKEFKDGEGNGIEALMEMLKTPNGVTGGTSNISLNQVSSLSNVVNEINNFVTSKEPNAKFNLSKNDEELLIKAGVSPDDISKAKSGDRGTIKSLLQKVDSFLVGLKTSLSSEDQKKVDSLLGKGGKDNSGVRGLIDIIDNPTTHVPYSESDISTSFNQLSSNLNIAIETLSKNSNSLINGVSGKSFYKDARSQVMNFVSNYPISTEQKDQLSRQLIELQKKSRSGAFVDISTTVESLNKGNEIYKSNGSRSSSIKDIQVALEKKGIKIDPQNPEKLKSIMDSLQSQGQGGVVKLLRKDFATLTSDEITKASEFLGLDSKTTEQLKSGTEALKKARDIASGSISDIENLADSFIKESSDSGIKRHIGYLLKARLEQYKKSPEGSPQQVLNLAKLQETMSLFKQETFDFKSFKENLRSISDKYKSIDSSLIKSTSVSMTKEEIESLISQLPQDLRSSFLKSLSSPPNTSEMASFSANRSMSGHNTISSSSVVQDPEQLVKHISSMDPSSSKIDFSYSDVKRVSSLAPKLEDLNKYTFEGVNNRDLMKTIEGRTEILRRFNEAFSEELSNMSENIELDNQSEQDVSFDASNESLDDNINTLLKESERLEALVSDVDSSFDSSEANISKLLEGLRETIVKLEVEINVLSRKVKDKKKQDKSSETYSFDLKVTRELLSQLKEQLSVLHEKSYEEKKVKGALDSVDKMIDAIAIPIPKRLQ